MFFISSTSPTGPLPDSGSLQQLNSSSDFDWTKIGEVLTGYRRECAERARFLQMMRGSEALEPGEIGSWPEIFGAQRSSSASPLLREYCPQMVFLSETLDTTLITAARIDVRLLRGAVRETLQGHSPSSYFSREGISRLATSAYLLPGIPRFADRITALYEDRSISERAALCALVLYRLGVHAGAIEPAPAKH